MARTKETGRKVTQIACNENKDRIAKKVTNQSKKTEKDDTKKASTLNRSILLQSKTGKIEDQKGKNNAGEKKAGGSDGKMSDQKLKMNKNSNDDKDTPTHSNGMPKKKETHHKDPIQLKTKKSLPEEVDIIHYMIKCGGKENQIPYLIDTLSDVDSDENKAKNTITTWVNRKSRFLLKFFEQKAKKIFDIASPQTFPEILSEFKCMAGMRVNPLVLLQEEKHMVLHYFGLFCGFSAYINLGIQHILFADKGQFRPKLLKLSSYQLWIWLLSFLNCWISLAHLISTERLKRCHVFGYLFLEKALFITQEYFVGTLAQDSNVLPTGMKKLQDGTFALASYVISLNSAGKSDENDYLNWREIFNEPLGGVKSLVEKVERCVEQGNVMPVEVKNGDAVAGTSTRNHSDAKQGDVDSSMNGMKGFNADCDKANPKKGTKSGKKTAPPVLDGEKAKMAHNSQNEKIQTFEINFECEGNGQKANPSQKKRSSTKKIPPPIQDGKAQREEVTKSKKKLSSTKKKPSPPSQDGKNKGNGHKANAQVVRKIKRDGSPPPAPRKSPRFERKAK